MPRPMEAKEVSKSVCRLCGKQKMCRVLNYTAPRCRRPKRVPVCYECVSDDNVMPNVAYILLDKNGGTVKMSSMEKLLKQVVSQQSQMIELLGGIVGSRSAEIAKRVDKNKEELEKDGKKELEKDGKKKMKKDNSSYDEIIKAIEGIGAEVVDEGGRFKKIFKDGKKIGQVYESGRLKYKGDKKLIRVTLEEFLEAEEGSKRVKKDKKKVKKNKVKDKKVKKAKKDKVVKKGKKAKKAKKE